ncbi:MAG TPA: hypothetical protein VFK33_06350 [Bacillales bacterium]|nr:hypothetical protein [Bacillales bacterium]
MEQKRKFFDRKQEIPTDTPLNPEIMISIDEGGLDTDYPYPGDSVDEHKELENANHYFAEEIIKQHHENS